MRISSGATQENGDEIRSKDGGNEEEPSSGDAKGEGTLSSRRENEAGEVGGGKDEENQRNHSPWLGTGNSKTHRETQGRSQEGLEWWRYC